MESSEFDMRIELHACLTYVVPRKPAFEKRDDSKILTLSEVDDATASVIVTADGRRRTSLEAAMAPTSVLQNNGSTSGYSPSVCHINFVTGFLGVNRVEFYSASHE